MVFFGGFQWSNLEMMCTILGWGILVLWGVYIYRRQELEERPKVWKVVIAGLIGLFSFTLHIPFYGEIFSLSILPLGVWIVYGLTNGKGRWQAYRKYAWVGFLGNYLFLFTAFLSIGLSGLFYPKDEVETYLADVTKAEILVIHPSGKTVDLDVEKLENSLHTFEPARSDVVQWFEEIREQKWPSVETEQPEKVQEKFPYLLTGVKAKTGEKIHVYVESDGKGFLVTTKNNQYYYQSSSASFLEERGSAE